MLTDTFFDWLSVKFIPVMDFSRPAGSVIIVLSDVNPPAPDKSNTMFEEAATFIT